MSKQKTRNVEIQRTCQRCGARWFLTAKEAKAKEPKAPGWWTKSSAKGLFGTRARQKIRQYETSITRFRCPKCGSSSYTDSTGADDERQGGAEQTGG